MIKDEFGLGLCLHLYINIIVQWKSQFKKDEIYGCRYDSFHSSASKFRNLDQELELVDSPDEWWSVECYQVIQEMIIKVLTEIYSGQLFASYVTTASSSPFLTYLLYMLWHPTAKRKLCLCNQENITSTFWQIRHFGSAANLDQHSFLRDKYWSRLVKREN